MLTANATANRIVEQEFFAWADAIGLAEKLRTMRLARVSDGESFGLLTNNPRIPTPVQLDVKLVEAEQVTAPSLNKPPARYLDGIQFDEYGNPINYDVLREHPGDNSFSLTENYDTVGAIAVLHYDAVAVWDDDDIYLPEHLTVHAQVLATSPWSKPSQIISAYFDPPRIESAAGRFHGSIALRRDMLQELALQHGTPWIDITRATFDQEFLTRCTQHSPPGDPCQLASPQYIYRWQTTKSGHCSGLMDRTTCYRDYQPDSRAFISSLIPQTQSDTIRIIGPADSDLLRDS